LPPCRLGAGRSELWEAVKELAEHGTTVLLTTQNLESIADRQVQRHRGEGRS
jgi:ABC-2 type transport system ATP-binding protein